MRCSVRAGKSRSAAAVTGPGAAPVTAASYSSVRTARARSAFRVRRNAARVGRVGSLRRQGLPHSRLELVVRRLREDVERQHAFHDAARWIDGEERTVVRRAADRTIPLAVVLVPIAA